MPDGSLMADSEHEKKGEAAYKNPCWDDYVQIGMKKGKGGRMVPNCVPATTSAISEAAAYELSSGARTPAPKKDQRKGSAKNPKGSASGGGTISFDAKTETGLKNKVADHNKSASQGRKATLSMLKAVYRRGAGAYSTSHRPGQTRGSWAMARVNAYLKLLRSGKPSKAAYTQDNDLLPASHPKSSKKSASSLTASGVVVSDSSFLVASAEVALAYGVFDESNQASLDLCLASTYALGELRPSLLSGVEYNSVEEAIVSLVEASGMGYDVEFAIKAAWLRAVRDGDDPYERAKQLALSPRTSSDIELLPKDWGVV